jgi:hypothetical protein
LLCPFLGWLGEQTPTGSDRSQPAFTVLVPPISKFGSMLTSPGLLFKR